jgi:hypothetical protein
MDGPRDARASSAISINHLIDDGDEIRERFVAHGRIWPMWSKSQESAVDRPVDHAPTHKWNILWHASALSHQLGSARRGLKGPVNFRPRWRLAMSRTLRLIGREACGGK